MGINYSSRLRFKTDRDWHCFGHILVPKNPWVGLLNTPGMRSISVEGKRPDDYPGMVVVTADPIMNLVNEAILRVNDHIERSPDDKSVGAAFFLEVLEKDYEKIISRSKALLDDLIEGYLKQSTFDDGIVANQ